MTIMMTDDDGDDDMRRIKKNCCCMFSLQSTETKRKNPTPQTSSISLETSIESTRNKLQELSEQMKVTTETQ